MEIKTFQYGCLRFVIIYKIVKNDAGKTKAFKLFIQFKYVVITLLTVITNY